MRIVISIVGNPANHFFRFDMEPVENLDAEVVKEFEKRKELWPQESGAGKEMVFADDDRAAYQDPDYEYVMHRKWTGELWVEKFFLNTPVMSVTWEDFVQNS